MWFKNLQIYRLPLNWDMTSSRLEECLSSHAFEPGTSMDLQSCGWAAPRDNGKLVHEVNRQMLIMFSAEKKLLPSSIVNQVAKEKVLQMEEQQGFKPGKKQVKEIKEQVVDELLPRAFRIRRNTFAWIDPINGWLVIDAASPARTDEVFGLLVKSVDQLPARNLRVSMSPTAAMTSWLSSNEAPGGFSVDQDTELRSTGEAKSSVRYIRHTLEADDVQRHIASGKVCVRLAMTWADRISFILTESLGIKRVAPLDVIKENRDAVIASEDECFDSDFALMAGELSGLLTNLVAVLGGEANA